MSSATGIRRASERGVVDYGWLKSCYSFSFASYYDPEQMGFSDLLILNDDWVAAGGYFEKRLHREMEVFTYVLNGELELQDTDGIKLLVSSGEAQLLSVGSAGHRSGCNASPRSPLHFLQIWIVPAERGGTSRYQQKAIQIKKRRGQLCLVLSPDGQDGSLIIKQETCVYAGIFDGSDSASLTLPLGRFAYVHLARGSLTVNGQRLDEGDGLKIRHANNIELSHGENAEVLIFDLRPMEKPSF